MEAAARASLVAAGALARSGDRQRAREVCAAVLFEMQPIIAARTDLLRPALYALLMAHGFRLLSRVALAMSGVATQVVLRQDWTGPVAQPQRTQTAGRTIYVLDPRWLDQLLPDDMFLRQWSDALAARKRDYVERPGPASVPRRLEPV